MIARTRANIAAAQKPLVLNPAIKLSTRRTIRTLMMSETRPRVIQLRGAVSIFKRSQIVALTRPRTSATIRAVTKPSISTPGTRYAAAKTATADNRSDIRNFIVKIRKLEVKSILPYLVFPRKFALHFFSLQSLYAKRKNTPLHRSNGSTEQRTTH